MQKLTNSCQENGLFDVEDQMCQEPDQDLQKDQQDPLSFVNDFLLPPTFTDENKNTDNLNYPLNYSTSFLSGSNPYIEKSANLNVETSQKVLQDFKSTPPVCYNDNFEKRIQQNSTPNEFRNYDQSDLQTLLSDLLEPPTKKRRGRPLGSKNNDKKNQPSTQRKRAPKSKTSNQQPTSNSQQSGVGQQYPQTLPAYPQAFRFTQEKPGNFSQTNGYLSPQPVLPQQNGYPQQPLGFSQAEYSQQPPFSYPQQSSQFIQPSSSKSSNYSHLSKSNYSQQLSSNYSSSQNFRFPQIPNSQSSNFSPEFCHSQPPSVSQDYPEFSKYPQYSEFGQQSLQYSPQYSDYLGQSTANIKSHVYGQPAYDQQFLEYKSNLMKSYQHPSYSQPPPDYSEHLFRYAQPLMDYAKQQDYYQEYPQVYDQPVFNPQLDPVEKFPKLDEYPMSTQNRLPLQFPVENQQNSLSQNRFLDQSQQILTQNQVPDQRFSVQSQQIAPQGSIQNQVPVQSQYKCTEKQSLYANQIAQNVPSAQVPFPVEEIAEKNYQSYPIQTPQFHGYKFPYDTKGIYEDVKKNLEYEQKPTRSMSHYLNDSHLTGYDSQFIPPPSYNDSLNHQNLQTHGFESSKLFRSWHTPEGFSQNKTEFPKDNSKLLINKFLPNPNFQHMNNSANFSTISNSDKISGMGNVANLRSQVQQNSIDPLSFFDNNSASSKDKTGFFPLAHTNDSPGPPNKCLEKEYIQNPFNKIELFNGKVVSQFGPNFFYQPIKRRTITASYLDSQSDNAKKIREFNANLENRDWLVNSPAPLEIVCPENRKRKRTVYRKEYKPRQGIRRAVERYRAKGFLTRSPCPKNVSIEKDPLADNSDNSDNDDDEDEDDDDEDIEEENKEVRSKEGERRDEEYNKNETKFNQKEAYAKKETEHKEINDDNKEEYNETENGKEEVNPILHNKISGDFDFVEKYVQNNEDFTNSEGENFPTVFDNITGRWVKSDDFKKSQIHHQGLPNLQRIFKSECNKIANCKQTKSFNSVIQGNKQYVPNKHKTPETITIE